MNERVLVKPAKGLRVPLPDHPKQYLPEAGRVVIYDQYWFRRVAEGAVTIQKLKEADNPEPAPAPASSPDPAEEKPEDEKKKSKKTDKK